MEESSGRALTPKAWRTRERILGAALGLFADKGYEATTMRMWLGRRREPVWGLRTGTSQPRRSSRWRCTWGWLRSLRRGPGMGWLGDGGGAVRGGDASEVGSGLPIAVPWLPSSPVRSTPTRLSASGRHRRGSREDGRCLLRSCGALAMPPERSRQGSWGTSSTRCTWPSCSTGSTTRRRMLVPHELVGSARETLRYLRPRYGSRRCPVFSPDSPVRWRTWA